LKPGSKGGRARDENGRDDALTAKCWRKGGR